MATREQVERWRALAKRRLGPDQWNVSKPELELARDAVPAMATFIGRLMRLAVECDMRYHGILTPGYSVADESRALVAEWRGEVDDG